jgi:hypothetical protein
MEIPSNQSGKKRKFQKVMEKINKFNNIGQQDIF